ncbi:hypothetical protein M8J77_018683 [Diaphorina citri]|nr:hypothetical protein M8J77_018683 [Diaphorina citri]
MLKAGKLEEVKDQMKKANLNILGICETRWAGNGDFKSDEFRVIHSGGERRGRNGVAVILRGKWKDNVLNTYHLNDRILMIKLEAKPTNIYIIQVYLPTSRSTDEEVDEIYEQIEELLQLTENNSNIFILGDFNASVGAEQSQCSGKFGLGNRNERGTRMLEFCEQHEFIVSNTYFEVPLRRRYTWKAPGDRQRYQIDYILIKRKFKNQIKSCYAYPGYDIDSDHNLLMATCKIKFKRRPNQPKHKKWSLEKLKDKTIAKQFKDELEESHQDTNDWEDIKQNIIKATDKIIGKDKLVARKPWMTQEILNLILERNKLRNKDQEKYKQKKNEITTKCRLAKEEWLEHNIKDIELDLLQNNTGKAYNKVKKLQHKSKTSSNIVRDNNGKILFENDKVADRWKEYLEELYEGVEIGNEEDYIEKEEDVDKDSLGPEILRSEFNKSLKELTDKKATGIDQIPAEVLKNLGRKTEDKLFNIINNCYNNGTIPSDFIKSKTITLPKKDDIVILAESEADMNNMLEILANTLEKYKLKINARKTKTMLISKTPNDHDLNISLKNTLIEEVKEFCYLGSKVTNNNKSSPDIKVRIAPAKQAFQNKNQLLTSKHLSIDLRKRFIKTFVWSVMTYGSETWTIEKKDRARLEAAEMWMWRRMTKTRWIEKKSNERVLEEVGESRQLIKTIEKRKIKLIGHIIRHNNFITNIFEGKIQGKKTRGRPRKQYFKDMQESMRCTSFSELKSVANNRNEWLHRQGLAFRY